MVPPQPSRTSDADVLDGIVIGGGPAGRIRLTEGKFLPRSALFFSPGQYQRSPLAEQLGCEFCEGNNQ